MNDDAPHTPAPAPGQRPDDAPNGLQTKLRVCRAKPFCWQHKDARRRIREAFDRAKTVHSALGIYDALTEIASDKQSEVFETTHAYIAQMSGWSPRTVQDRLDELVEIGLIEIHTPALKAPSTIRLLAVTDWQPLLNAPQRQKKVALPTLEQGKKKELNNEEESPRTRKRETWQLLRDEKSLKDRLQTERESVKPDKELIESLKADLRQVRAEMKGQKKS